MKRFLVIAILSLAMPALAVQAADKKEHPPEKAMDSATPEMKNPGGSEKLHPPQKAMDEAAPSEKTTDASAGGSTGASGMTSEQPSWDVRKAGESVELSGGKK